MFEGSVHRVAGAIYPKVACWVRYRVLHVKNPRKIGTTGRYSTPQSRYSRYIKGTVPPKVGTVGTPVGESAAYGFTSRRLTHQLQCGHTHDNSVYVFLIFLFFLTDVSSTTPVPLAVACCSTPPGCPLFLPRYYCCCRFSVIGTMGNVCEGQPTAVVKLT